MDTRTLEQLTPSVVFITSSRQSHLERARERVVITERGGENDRIGEGRLVNTMGT